MPDRNSAPPRAWQRMLSGRRLDLLDPSPLDVEIEDVAHGLARVARWNGQTKGDHAYSVAQHSLLVEQIFLQLDPEAAPKALLTTLLHDAPEYVIGDMISPFKQVMGGEYKHIEDRLQAAIHVRFGLPAATTKKLKTAIKRADQIAAYYEATTLAGFSQEEAITYFGRPYGVTAEDLSLEPMATIEAQDAFLARFEEIQAAHSLNRSA